MIGDLGARDATALAELVAAREVTPDELLDAALRAVEARNPAINAVVLMQEEVARRSGLSAEAVIAAHLGDAYYETNRIAEMRGVIEKYLPFIQQQCIDYQAVRTIGNDRLCYGDVGDDLTGHMKFMF